MMGKLLVFCFEVFKIKFPKDRSDYFSSVVAAAEAIRPPALTLDGINL